MSCLVRLCHVMLCYVMLCYVMLCYVVLCCNMLCYMLCFVILCYVVLCYIILYMTTLYYYSIFIIIFRIFLNFSFSFHQTIFIFNFLNFHFILQYITLITFISYFVSSFFPLFSRLSVYLPFPPAHRNISTSSRSRDATVHHVTSLSQLAAAVNRWPAFNY